MLDNIIKVVFVGCTAMIVYNLIKLVYVVIKYKLGK
jgi:hypothetical protein